VDDRTHFTVLYEDDPLLGFRLVGRHLHTKVLLAGPESIFHGALLYDASGCCGFTDPREGQRSLILFRNCWIVDTRKDFFEVNELGGVTDQIGTWTVQSGIFKPLEITISALSTMYCLTKT
jgi:hypothetical protein